MFSKIRYFSATLGQSWFILLLIVVVGSILGVPFSLISSKISSPILQEIASKTLPYIVMFLPAILYAYYKGKSIQTRTLITEDNSKYIALNKPQFGKFNPILFFILIAITMVALNFAIEPIMSLMPVPEWFERIMKIMVGGNIYVSVLTVGICAALFEELICRGIIMRGLLNHISPSKAIIWSALIFAVMHLNPWQAIPAFVFGIFFGWIYYRTHCLWATIFLHFVNNTTATLISYYYPEIDTATSYRGFFPSADAYMLTFAISIGVLAISYFLISKYTKPVKTFN